MNGRVSTAASAVAGGRGWLRSIIFPKQLQTYFWAWGENVGGEGISFKAGWRLLFPGPTCSLAVEPLHLGGW